MKILIVGQQKDWAIEHHYIRHLSAYTSVGVYPAEEVFDDFYWKSKWNKIRFRLGLSRIQQKIGQGLLAKARSFRPDIIWVFKGMRLLPGVLKKLKSEGFFLVNYNPDHPFIFSSKGSGNQNVTDAVGLYDLHLCYSHSVAGRIEKEYGIPTALLPFGYELPDDLFSEINNTPEILKACFIGNPDPKRVAYLKAMAAAGVSVDVYGHGWDKHLPPTPGLNIFPAAYKKEFWKNMRAYRVQVNIFRPHNEGSHNMRTFEIPAAGGIMLAPDNHQHRSFFKQGEEVFFYKNKKELIAGAKYILTLPKEKADRIRRKARRRSVQSGYDYKSRAAQAADAFQMALQP